MASGSAYAFPFERRGAAGTALAITLYVGVHSRAKRLLAGLYLGQNGHLRSLITSGTLKSPKPGAWNTVRVAAAGIRPGLTYWIAVLGQGGALYYRAVRSHRCSAPGSRKSGLRSLPSVWRRGGQSKYCRISAYASGTRGTVGPVAAPPASKLYGLPADRTFAWNPGLSAVGGIPGRTSIYRMISPSGGDDTATIQAALDGCPRNGVVRLTAGTFHISGQGLSIERSYCTLRGAGPGAGNPGVSASQKVGSGAGTFLVKTLGTSYPVAIIGPRWTGGTGTVTNLTSDAVRGSHSVTVASTSGLSVGGTVVVDELTDPSISHWNTRDPENKSGWFEERNRPLGDVMEIASIRGHTLTFSTPFPITYQMSRSAHLYPLKTVVRYSGIEDVYMYGGEGGDGGGGIHLWNCDHCWVKHVEDTWTGGAAVHLDNCFSTEIRDSYFHDSEGGLYGGGGNYGIGLNWYTSNTLVENNIVIRYDKVDVMRSAGGGNVFGYNYLDDAADNGGQWEEDGLNSSHMTTPHYELFEGNEASNFDQDNRWGNSVYITVFRNHFTAYNRSFLNYGPYRAAGVTQWHEWQSFVGNVLGSPSNTDISGYEAIGGGEEGSGHEWMLCYGNDGADDGGKCLATVLRDGNFDYYTGKVHWHGIGGTGANNGLIPPANSTLPASMYLSGKPAFFGSSPWPWVDGSNAANPVPGQLPARVRYDAGTPNAVQ
jgi:hypothetical protein